jgi:hypothetical protein
MKTFGLGISLIAVTCRNICDLYYLLKLVERATDIQDWFYGLEFLFDILAILVFADAIRRIHFNQKKIS